jgi:hypothetical protein
MVRSGHERPLGLALSTVGHRMMTIQVRLHSRL